MFKKIAITAVSLFSVFLAYLGHAHAEFHHHPPLTALASELFQESFNHSPAPTPLPSPQSSRQIAENFFAAPWSTYASNQFKTTCTLSIPMQSDRLFIQNGVIVDFQEVTQNGAGYIYAPYCILTLNSDAYDQQITTTGKLTIDPGLHEFQPPEVNLETHDFFSTSCVSINYFQEYMQPDQAAKSPFMSAFCFVPETYISNFINGMQLGLYLQPFTLENVEDEFKIQCQKNQTVKKANSIQKNQKQTKKIHNKKKK